VKYGRSDGQRNKATSVRPLTIDEACTFAFTVFCSAATNSYGKWYLSRRSSPNSALNNSDCQFHMNHLPIPSDHLNRPRLGSITPAALAKIKNQLASGATIESIVLSMKQNDRIIITDSQIRKIKDDMIYDEIIKTGEKVSYSSASRLIQLFKSNEDVSYVYVKHTMQSGFVSYRKTLGINRETVIPHIGGMHNATNDEDIESWRKELKLDDSNEILVAFAWSHNEEARLFSMFPEFIAADLTFGINRQRRPLFVMTGVDGDNKAFTGLRCFMPSKSKEAYQWVLHDALPFLVGQSTADRICCISTDCEEALSLAIQYSMQLDGGLPKSLKHRLDFYHVFVQKWNQKCTAPTDCSDSCRFAMKTIQRWVYSWVYDIETEEEFMDSLRLYEKYFQSLSDVLTDHLKREIKICVDRVISNIDKIGNHFFTRTVTLGFVGSSIVEGTNPGIKGGIFGTKGTMNLDHAGSQMIKQCWYKGDKRAADRAHSLRRYKHWSASKTRDTLTSYQEGLTVKRMDNCEHYIVVHSPDNDNKKWYVYNKAMFVSLMNGTSAEHTNPHVPGYHRIRRVSVDAQGFMSCSCAYTFNYMAPCVHLLAVLGEQDRVVPSLFHIRWWEVFNYYFLTDFGKQTLPEVHDAMERALSDTSNNCFSGDRKFKGCLTTYCETDIATQFNATDNDELERDVAIQTVKYIERNGCLRIGSMDYNKMKDTAHSDDSDAHEFDTNDNVDGYGGGSEAVSRSSPSKNVCHVQHEKDRGVTINDTEDYHLMMSVLEAANSESQKQYLRKTLLEIRNKFLTENRKALVAQGELTFLSEDNSSGKRISKRRKLPHECSYKNST